MQRIIVQRHVEHLQHVANRVRSNHPTSFCVCSAFDFHCFQWRHVMPYVGKHQKKKKKNIVNENARCQCALKKGEDHIIAQAGSVVSVIIQSPVFIYHTVHFSTKPY